MLRRRGRGSGSQCLTPGRGQDGDSFGVTLQMGADGVGRQASTTYTLTVEGPPAITSKAKLTVAAGQTFSFKLSASGYPHATFTHTALPRGLRWAVKAGRAPTISGQLTAKQSGVHKVTITAKNHFGTARQVLTIYGI